MALLTILSITGVLLFPSLGYLVHTVYTHRRKIDQLRQQGVKYVNRIPPDAAVAFAMRDLCQEYANTEVFVMDFWPIYPALFTLFGPETITQVCNKYNLPKPSVASRSMKPVVGGLSLVSMNGDEWKYWRSLFNPGFSTGTMLNNVPHIVDSAVVFRNKLIENVDKGIVLLDELTTKLTMEIILKVTLDDDSNYQQSPHVLPTALGRILRWHSFWDTRVLLHPLRPFVQRYNGYVMDTYIRKELAKRFDEIKAESNFDRLQRKSKDIKSAITLAIEAYLDEQQTKGGTPEKDVLDERFVAYATSQIRLFLFAGTDTTSSMMVYVYHMLAKHPHWLTRLRNEHDRIFGVDPSEAAGFLKDTPSLLNSCKLTLAFIKETLRLYAPAGTVRSGIPGMTVTDLQGNEQPIQYAGANIPHQALHVNPRIWPRPNDFLPQRFLVRPEHELYPDPTAFRPFEQGPRSCIGQTLVWNELSVVVILTCRDLKIRDAYDDFDATRQRQMGIWGRWKTRLFGEPIKTVHGDRAYQTDSGGLHPTDGYPCYVERARDD
ncbi:putative cytochrome P450 [Xylaria digitata]|nr:putative cytochrome P450 [Xylaria digitata]